MEKFIKYYTENIHRPGADKLLEYLKSTDFFKAPASTRYHGNYEGGLCKHSVNVYTRLSDRCGNSETVAIVSLLHDICKADFYTTDYRNVKQPDGTWQRVPYYTIEDQLPIGTHADKSVFIVQRFMQLSNEEIAAIRFHMGGFQEGDSRSFSNAASKYPLVIYLHEADMEASYFDD